MHQHSVYSLADGVQVRSEAFGLLFYDYRGPRLFFVPSGNLLTDRFFEGKQSLATLLDQLGPQPAGSRQQVVGQVMRLLDKLERKGLIHGQPLC